MAGLDPAIHLPGLCSCLPWMAGSEAGHDKWGWRQ